MNVPWQFAERADALSPPSAPRLVWLDCAKGIGICLVVFGHALIGLIDSPLGAGLNGFRELLFATYSFHMPLFFLLAGATVAQRLAGDRQRFVESLALDVAWPYFLWSIVQFSLIFMLGGIVNQPAEDYWPTVLALPWQPTSQYWFLYAIFLLHGAALFCARGVGPAGFIAIALAAKPLAMATDAPVVLQLTANHAEFYAFGLALGPAGIAALAVSTPRAARALWLPIVAIAAVLVVRWSEAAAAVDFTSGAAIEIWHFAWSYAALPAALAGSIAAIGIASLAGGPTAAMLAYLGRRSMPIFILHVLASAGMRVVGIHALGMDDPVLLLLVTVAAGIAAPLAVFAVAARLGWTRILGLGRS